MAANVPFVRMPLASVKLPLVAVRPPKLMVPPPRVMALLVAPKAVLVVIASVPAFTIVPPVKLLDPERVAVPVPVFVRVDDPAYPSARVAVIVPLLTKE